MEKEEGSSEPAAAEEGSSVAGIVKEEDVFPRMMMWSDKMPGPLPEDADKCISVYMFPFAVKQEK